MASYWATLSDFDLALDRTHGAIGLGHGVDLSDPNNPILRSFLPFKEAAGSLLSYEKTARVTGPINDSSRVIVTSNDYEEALVLNAYFSASFGFSGFQAAFNFARSSRTHEQTIYVIIESSGSDDTIVQPSLDWQDRPDSEEVHDPDDRLQQIVATYGSHYVSSLTYSFRVAIRGSLQTLDTSQFASFSAAFSGWGVSAGAAGSAASKLRKMNATFDASIVAGSISGNLWVVKSFDDIQNFLSEIRDGSIAVTRGPIQAHLTNYWATLIKYPKTREVLKPGSAQPPSAPYGVPRGTILPWWPNPSDLRQRPGPSGALVEVIVPPIGWAICDGSANTPSLVNRFLLGGAALADIGRIGGRSEHQHSGGTGNVAHKDGGYGTGGTNPPECVGLVHDHNFNTDNQSHMPPYIGVVYIIKL